MRIRINYFFSPLLLISNAVIADVILQPESALTNADSLFPVENIINQSGLSATYNSLVDDFDSYISSDPTSHHGRGDNVWGTTEGIRSADIIFSLGDTYKVNKVALWNLTDDPSAIKDFTIFTDDDPGFSSPIKVGDYTALESSGIDDNTLAQVFDIGGVSTSYIMLSINNTWSPASYSLAFSEIAFSVTPVPVPPSLLLFLSGFISLLSVNKLYKNHLT